MVVFVCFWFWAKSVIVGCVCCGMVVLIGVCFVDFAVTSCLGWLGGCLALMVWCSGYCFRFWVYFGLIVFWVVCFYLYRV